MYRKARRFQIALLLVIFAFSLTAYQGAWAQGGDENDNDDNSGGTTEERITFDTTGGVKAVTRRLQELDLIPGGGQYFEIKNGAYIEAKQEGFTTVSLRADIAPRDFVMQFQMGSDLRNEQDGCGVVFRNGENTYSLVMLTNNRRLLLQQVVDRENAMLFDESIDDLEGINSTDYTLDEQDHVITVIALKDTVTFFLDGIQITTQDAQSVRGTLAAALYNEEGNTRTNGCYYINIWVVVYR
jgi:hypothetical protein